LSSDLATLTRIVRMKSFEQWIVDMPNKNVITKIFIWRHSNELKVLTVTSLSKEEFILLEELITQIESLVSDVQSNLDICYLYEFLDIKECNFSGYWTKDEDGNVYIEPYMQIEHEILKIIQSELSCKYNFQLPDLLNVKNYWGD